MSKRPKGRTPTSERCRTARVADITSLSVRQIQHMAARGLLPSAAKLGNVWTFNEKVIRQWIEEKERETYEKASIGEMAFRVPAFDPEARRYEEAYEQAFGLKRGNSKKRSPRRE